jgi:hypothetical protein
MTTKTMGSGNIDPGGGQSSMERMIIKDGGDTVYSSVTMDILDPLGRTVDTKTIYEPAIRNSSDPSKISKH